MNVSINGKRAGKDSPQTAQVRRKYRAHILSWCMDTARIRVCLNSQRGIIPCRLSSLDGLFLGRLDNP